MAKRGDQNGRAGAGPFVTYYTTPPRKSRPAGESTAEPTGGTDVVIRAFELPMARADAATWAILRECWRHSVSLANWCVTEMLRNDDPDLPHPPEFDLYARAFGREFEGRGRKDNAKVLPSRKPGFKGREFFQGAKLSAASIIDGVQSLYRKDRFEVQVRHSRSPRVYRDYPWPVHGQSVKAAWIDPNGRPWLRLTLPGGQVELQLRNGRDFAPQMARFRDLIARKDAGLPFKEVVLREKRCRGGDVLVKMVAEAPVREKTGDRPLVLLTDPSCFWDARFVREGVGDMTFVRAWVLNNDHWRRVTRRHHRHLEGLHRMGQDAKAERRAGNNVAWQQAARLELQCEKDKNRLASFTHEAACHLAEFCRRNDVGEVYYLDRDRGFVLDSFPWDVLQGKLEQKLTERGIALYSESGLKAEAPPPQDETEPGVVEISPGEGDVRWHRNISTRIRALRILLAARRRTA